MATSDRFHIWKHLQIFPSCKWLNLKGMVKVVLTSSPSARILVAATQPFDASPTHGGVLAFAVNIVSRVSPLSTKPHCNTCHWMASWAILRRYSIVIVAVTTLAWDAFLVTTTIKSLKKTAIPSHSCKHTCHRGTRCQSRPGYKSLKTVRLCQWRCWWAQTQKKAEEHNSMKSDVNHCYLICDRS